MPVSTKHCCVFSLITTCAAAACSDGTEPVRLVGGGASGTEPTRPGVQSPAGDGVGPTPVDDGATTTTSTVTDPGTGATAPETRAQPGGGGVAPHCDNCPKAHP
ncbi:MAG: hypothetical protein AAGA56_25010, partial [Myxococcota bacterium]